MEDGEEESEEQKRGVEEMGGAGVCPKQRSITSKNMEG